VSHAPLSRYLGVFAALVLLTGLTILASGQDFGWLNTPIALGIAAAKATLVGLFFMHLYGAPSLVRLTAFAAIVWLGILVSMLVGDYMRREPAEGWEPPATPASFHRH
jgi:cytochrome c oxidase subunit IV